MNENFTCDIIKDLLPGYIDGVLSEAGTSTVKTHLEECQECHGVYLEMKEGWNAETQAKEQVVLDGFKKVRQRTRKLKTAVGIVSGLLAVLVLSVFIKFFVIGIPLSTHEISIDTLSYDEETNCLEISGTVNLASCRVSRVVWEKSKENDNAVNILVYNAETLPFQKEKNKFTITVPDMKGKIAYLACPNYDQFEIYHWKYHHNDKLSELENEIYDFFPELDRDKDPLSYGSGITTVDGIEGISYCVDSIVGENATFYRINDQLVTDGDFEPRDFDIWISLEKPYQILIYDYKSGKYTDDYSIINRRTSDYQVTPITPAVTSVNEH